MFPNQQGRAEANWGSVAGKSSHLHVCTAQKTNDTNLLGDIFLAQDRSQPWPFTRLNPHLNSSVIIGNTKNHREQD